MGANAIAFIRALGLSKVDVLGFSIGGMVAQEIALQMWGNIAVTQAYLTLSEVLGHIDLLLVDGKVAAVQDGPVIRFGPA